MAEEEVGEVEEVRVELTKREAARGEEQEEPEEIEYLRYKISDTKIVEAFLEATDLLESLLEGKLPASEAVAKWKLNVEEAVKNIMSEDAKKSKKKTSKKKSSSKKKTG